MFALRKDWFDLLQEEFEKDYFEKMLLFLQSQYNSKVIYPPKEKVFNALNHLPFKEVKVVIMGQDPYHEIGQAEGLAFSVPEGVKCPPSLENIKKEITSELGVKFTTSGCLHNWVKQGVLLLNSVLTVEEHKANSHKDIGWQIFTKKIIEILNKSEKPICFVAWGNNAKNVLKDIDRKKHYYLESAHPSPLSCYNGFYGNGHFKKINDFLVANGEKPIDWKV